MYSIEDHGVVYKLSCQDVVNQRPSPKLKVSSKQKIIYKLAKSQTLRKQIKRQKPKQWKIEHINPQTNSLKIALWTHSDTTALIAETSFTNNKASHCCMDYKSSAMSKRECSEMYHKLGLSSMDWTRHETDLLLALCNDFGCRWCLIIDRFNDCKPPKRPNRSMTQIKERYYECARLISKQNEFDFEYNAKREEHRREQLEKLLMRSHDENIEISQSAQYYRKHSKLLRKRVSEMQQKRAALRKQSKFICNRQQMTLDAVRHSDDSLPFGQYHGFGVTVHDTMAQREICGENEIKLPPQCKLKKVAKIERNIQMIDDEYTKYKYELKLDGSKVVTVPFPFVCNKKKNENERMSEDELLTSSNANLGKDIARMIQQQLIKENVITICPNTKIPKMHPMTNTTRSMLNVLRRDYIKYYAMRVLINDLKKKKQKK